MAEDRIVLKYLEMDMTEAEVHSVGRGRAGVVSVSCPTTEGVNEDAAAIFWSERNAGVLLVADGLGGATTGQVASRIAIDQIEAALRDGAANESLMRTAILNGIENANEAVLKLGTGAATTFAAVEVDDATVRPYHIGDTMIFIIGGRGKIKFQTTAHSPVGYAVESGMLHETDALNHEERHIVSNVVGSTDMHIEIGPTIKLAALDTVIIASDGLIDNLTQDEIIRMARIRPLKKALLQMKDLATGRMLEVQDGAPSKPDDLTIVGYRPASK